NKALGAQDLHGLIYGAGLLKLVLGRKMVVVDAEQPEVMLDQVEHRGDAALAEDRQPFAFRSVRILIAKLGGESHADRHEVLARADLGQAVFFTLAKNGPELVAPCVGLQSKVDEAGTRNLHRRNGR